MEHKTLAFFFDIVYTLCKRTISYIEERQGKMSKQATTKSVPFSVYMWAEKNTGIVRYIGQTNNIARRTTEHLSLKGDNILFNKFIIDHLVDGILPEIFVVETCKTREQAIRLERAYIHKHEDTVYNLQ